MRRASPQNLQPSLLSWLVSVISAPCLSLVFGLFASLPGMAAIEGVTPPEVTQAAERDISEFMTAAKQAPQDFGFDLNDDLSTARLGMPLRTHALKLDLLKQADLPKSKLSALVEPQPEWLFPVLIGKDARCFLVVRMGGGGKAVGAMLGFSALARNVQQAREAWPAPKHTFTLVSFSPVRSFHFAISGTEEENLTPLTQLEAVNGKSLPVPNNTRTLLKASETCEHLLKLAALREKE